MGSLLRGVDCYREQLRRFASRYRLPIFIAAQQKPEAIHDTMKILQ